MNFNKKFLKFIGAHSDSACTFVPDLTTRRVKMWTDPDSINW